jgi:hypothetical protein
MNKQQKPLMNIQQIVSCKDDKFMVICLSDNRYTELSERERAREGEREREEKR